MVDRRASARRRKGIPDANAIDVLSTQSRPLPKTGANNRRRPRPSTDTTATTATASATTSRPTPKTETTITGAHTSATTSTPATQPSAPDDDEVELERGNAHDPDARSEHANNNSGSSRPTKRRRNPSMVALTRDGISTTEAWTFFHGLTKELYDDEEALEFRVPVLKKYRASQVPNYRDLVKRPMDLGTIMKNLQTHVYTIEQDDEMFSFDASKCSADLRLVFENCMTYNETKSALYATGKQMLEQLDAKLKEREARLEANANRARAERQKREAERRRRRAAEMNAAEAAVTATRAAAALAIAKKEAQEAEMRREEEFRRKEAEWKVLLELEKKKAVEDAMKKMMAIAGAPGGAGGLNGVSSGNLGRLPVAGAVQAGAVPAGVVPGGAVPAGVGAAGVSVGGGMGVVVGGMQGMGGVGDGVASGAPVMAGIAGVGGVQTVGLRGGVGGVAGTGSVGGGDGMGGGVEEENGKVVNTSSVSSDEYDGVGGDISFAFVSTVGMEKKRGRKSAKVMDLESQHEMLMKRRRMMVDLAAELDSRKHVDMTVAEKRQLCADVALLDYVRMKGVVDILAKGMNRPDIRSEVVVDLDIDSVDNVVLREIEYFLKNPTAMTAKDALRFVESQIADIESQLVALRYQKSASSVAAASAAAAAAAAAASASASASVVG